MLVKFGYCYEACACLRYRECGKYVRVFVCPFQCSQLLFGLGKVTKNTRPWRISELFLEVLNFPCCGSHLNRFVCFRNEKGLAFQAVS